MQVIKWWVDSPANPKIKRRNFRWMFRSFIFGELTKGSKGVELPCKFRLCPDRVHPAQNGMPFCETCLSSPPRLQRFLRGVDAGKAASERALLFPHPLPKKIFRNLQGDDSGFVIFHRGWVSGKQCSVSEDCFLLVHCRRKITRLRSS